MLLYYSIYFTTRIRIVRVLLYEIHVLIDEEEIDRRVSFIILPLMNN